MGVNGGVVYGEVGPKEKFFRSGDVNGLAEEPVAVDPGAGDVEVQVWV